MKSLVGGGNEFRSEQVQFWFRSNAQIGPHQVEIINEHVLSHNPLLTGYGRIFRHLFHVPLLNKALIATVSDSPACPNKNECLDIVWLFRCRHVGNGSIFFSDSSILYNRLYIHFRAKVLGNA